jgi:hypothetical protein
MTKAERAKGLTDVISVTCTVEQKKQIKEYCKKGNLKINQFILKLARNHFNKIQ